MHNLARAHWGQVPPEDTDGFADRVLTLSECSSDAKLLLRGLITMHGDDLWADNGDLFMDWEVRHLAAMCADGLSVSAVRQALRELERQGFVRVRRLELLQHDGEKLWVSVDYDALGARLSLSPAAKQHNAPSGLVRGRPPVGEALASSDIERRK